MGAAAGSRGKPVVVSPRAQADIEDALGHYLREGGDLLAQRFADELEVSFGLLSRQPGMGSLRYATLLNLPDLRCWPLRPWPQLLFYLEREHVIDVVRVLHGARDIPAAMIGPDSPVE